MQDGAGDGHKWSAAPREGIAHIRIGRPVESSIRIACLKEPTTQ